MFPRELYRFWTPASAQKHFLTKRNEFYENIRIPLDFIKFQIFLFPDIEFTILQKPYSKNVARTLCFYMFHASGAIEDAQVVRNQEFYDLMEFHCFWTFQWKFIEIIECYGLERQRVPKAEKQC